MLEIRYNIQSGEVTGWWGNRHGNHEAKLKNRPDEAISLIDVPIPSTELGAWLFHEGDQILSVNPNYAESEPPRNLASEIDELKVRIGKLERYELI